MKRGKKFRDSSCSPGDVISVRHICSISLRKYVLVLQLHCVGLRSKSNIKQQLRGLRGFSILALMVSLPVVGYRRQLLNGYAFKTNKCLDNYNGAPDSRVRGSMT